MKERFLLPTDIYSPPQNNISVMSDRAFEVAVFNEVKKYISSRSIANKKPLVELTKSSADQGRDIVIKSYDQLDFLGIQIAKKKEYRNIFIECKLTTKKRLTLEHIASNVLQLNKNLGSENIFILVTNSTLTPRSLSIIEKQCKRIGMKFFLIDAWNISICLPSLVKNDQKNIYYRYHSKIMISYQILKDGYSINNYLIYLLFRVSPSFEYDIKASLHSTRDWQGKGLNTIQFKLLGGNLTCWTFSLYPSSLKFPKEFKVSTVISRERYLFNIPVVSTDEIESLPLFECKMSLYLKKIKQQLFDDKLPRFIHLHGKGGTGKSRFVQELFDEALMHNIPSHLITFLNEKDITITSRGYDRKTKSEITSNEILHLLKKISKSLYSFEKEIVLIDNIHFAKENILNEINNFSLKNHNNITLIVTGRSDTPFKRVTYEVFVHKILDIIRPNDIIQIELDDMSNNEVQAAISSIFKNENVGFSGLKQAGKTTFKPIDIVHAVHSLMERNQVLWSDEECLTFNIKKHEKIDFFSKDEVLVNVLDYRYEHLKDINLGYFTLAGTVCRKVCKKIVIVSLNVVQK